VGFFLRGGGGTEVDTVVLCAGLEHDALGGDGAEGQGEEEVSEEEDFGKKGGLEKGCGGGVYDE
jgi:hypothetical protein